MMVWTVKKIYTQYHSVGLQLHISLLILFFPPEFRTFVEKTEKELFVLFQGIDRDNDNRLDKDELQVAFKKAGLAISKSKLDLFFEDVDMNHDVRTKITISRICHGPLSNFTSRDL